MNIRINNMSVAINDLNKNARAESAIDCVAFFYEEVVKTTEIRISLDAGSAGMKNTFQN